MVDLGYKPEKGMEVSAKAKRETYYPSLHIDKDIGLDEKDVGRTMTAQVRIKVTSVEKRVSDKGGKRETCGLDILAIELGKKELGGKIRSALKK